MNPIRDKIDGNLAALIDGTLPPEESAQVKAILDADPQLSQQVAAMIADRQTLRGLPKTLAPVGLAEGVLAQLEHGSLLTNFDRDITISRGRLRNRLAIAALIAVVIGGFSYVVVQGVTSHKGQWGEWANSQIASAPEKKDLFPQPAAQPSAAADQKQTLKEVAGIPADAAGENKRPAEAAAPAPVTTPPSGAAASGGAASLLATGDKADGIADRDAQAFRRLENRKDIGVTDQLAAQASKDPANTEAALDDLACVNLHFQNAAPPLTLALAAQDPADIARLQRMLQAFTDHSAATNDRGGLALSGSNTYTGGTTISGGVLNINNGNAVTSSNGATGNVITGNSSNAWQGSGQIAVNTQSAQNAVTEQARQTDKESSAVAAVQQNEPAASQSRQRLDQQSATKLRYAGRGGNEDHAFSQGNIEGNNAATPTVTKQLENEDGRPLAPGTYRVSLTPQQVEALVATFTVRTVSRGDVVFNIDPNHPSAAPSYATNFGLSAKPAVAPAAPAAAVAAKGADEPASRVAVTGTIASAGALKTPSPAPIEREKALAKDEDATKTAPQLIDCIITIAPPPAATNTK